MYKFTHICTHTNYDMSHNKINLKIETTHFSRKFDIWGIIIGVSVNISANLYSLHIPYNNNNILELKFDST